MRKILLVSIVFNIPRQALILTAEMKAVTTVVFFNQTVSNKFLLLPLNRQYPPWGSFILVPSRLFMSAYFCRKNRKSWGISLRRFVRQLQMNFFSLFECYSSLDVIRNFYKIWEIEKSLIYSYWLPITGRHVFWWRTET